jgi:toxin ParE1/3/4
MSCQPIISRRGEIDLAHQYGWYLQNAGVDVAERYLAAFDASVARLGSQPRLGKVGRFRAPELAGMRWRAVAAPFSAHLVFYRELGDEVSIERVMHGARDLPQRLIEPP